MAPKDHIVLRVEGMTCDGCARHVTEVLKSTTGVQDAQVGNWRAGQATVRTDADVSNDDIVKAVTKAGYRGIVQARRRLEAERKAPSTEGADYDLMIIGAGGAAFAAAIKGSELGMRVALVESGTIGGTCVNVGCVPSKTLIRAAEICYKCSYQHFEGLTACPPPADWRRIVQQKDEIVAGLRQNKYIHVAEMYSNITILKGRARFTGKRVISVDGRSYSPGKILIATGSLPWAPPISGLKEAGFIDSTQAMSLPALPASMIVIGAGAIGLELAQLFARLGVKVTLLEVLPRIASTEEPEISDALARYLRAEKIDIHAGIRILNVERKDGTYRVSVEKSGNAVTLAGEQLLVATGRRPNTSDLGLELPGVQTGTRGEIIVNEHLQTSNADVFAAGDVIGDPMFVYVAAYGGKLAAENALAHTGRVFDLCALPRVTFTDPQIASVGLTEQQAREKGHKVTTSHLDLKEVPRALAARDTRGLMKLVAEEDGRLLGAHLLAAEAGDVIQEATLAIRFGLTVHDIVDTFHPYLTMVEGLKLAALTFEKDVTRLSCCAA